MTRSDLQISHIRRASKCDCGHVHVMPHQGHVFLRYLMAPTARLLSLGLRMLTGM